MPSPPDPRLAEALAHHRAGRLEQAVAGYEAAIAAGLDGAELRNNLGHALRGLGRREQALLHYTRAARQKQGYFRAELARAELAAELGRLAEAAEAFAAAIPLAPDPDALRIRLAGAQAALNRPDLAVATLRQVAPGRPDAAVLHNNLGNALLAVGQPMAGLSELRAAQALLPGRPEPLVNLAHAQMAAGQAEAAAAACAEALSIDADYWPAWHNRLLALNYCAGETPEAIAAEHRRFGERLAAATPALPPPDNLPEPLRRLRVGYLSGDLRGHSVGYFLDGVLAAHDQAAVEIVAYATQPAEDHVTARMRPHVAAWRSVAGLDDAALAARIRADAIDILVDLSGHSGHTRLPMLARRPAPVQAAWIGYPQTTGLAAIDWILADALVLPPQDEALYVERPMRLPGCYLCYAAPPPPVPRGPPPSLAAGFVTFGCFNGLAKLNDAVLAAWARILRELPLARLLVKTRALGEPAMAAAFRDRFHRLGGDAGRLELQGHLAARQHYARFADVDLMLDPFPYGGCTTLVEAIHAGVPTIALRGRGGMMTRSAETLLAAVGEPGWLAADLDEYVARAVGLARDREALAAARARLSPAALREAGPFARRLEAAYREMWRDWCGRQRP